ncbi:MAG: 4-hydroxy-tetrahydrodipicolinate synthase [Gaiellaceae bacterium]|jgi:4-hydroxy-tetrahydrodipicolinate synthase
MTANGKQSDFGTILTAIVTPFKEDRSVDFKRFKALARYLVEHGSEGLVISGSTGEGTTLSDREKLMLYYAAVEEVGERASVIAATGTYDTRHSAYLTAQAAEFVDGFLIVVPYYSKPPQRGVVEHYKAVAAATDKPIVVYNIPGRVIINVESETFTELAEIPNVVAVKQANPDLEQARQIVDETSLLLYAGNDELVLPFLELGGAGGICVYTHLAGPRVQEMVRRFRGGNLSGAKAMDDELKPLMEALAVCVNPISTKAALNLAGFDVGGLRLPLVDATPAELDQIRELLEQAEVLEPAVRA